MTMNRRNFVKAVGVGTAATAGVGLASCTTSGGTNGAGKGPHVVVVGGGFGGATAAKYVRSFDPNVKVTLIEANKMYVTCPGSNWVIGGLRNMDSITFSYGTLASRHGVNVVHERATGVDPDKRMVTTDAGSTYNYDRLILSPGVAFRWDTIEGYDPTVAETVPHAWEAGPQTALLRQQLEAMPDGGTFLIASPPNPFRCPPGPYERVSMVAHYFKQNKPRSKIVILDAKPKFSKQGLFTQGWEKLYGYGTDNSLIEWLAGPDGKLVAVQGSDTLVAGDLEDEFKGDVLNVIPPQKAGFIAEATGLTDDSGWCPVDHKTWESTVHKNIHVIGDASVQSPLPKSGYAANSEGKVCAAAVVNLLNGKEPDTPSWVNTCYSLVGPEHGISVAMVYELTADGKVGKVAGSGGVTPKDGNRSLEALYAKSWHANIVDDIFG